MEVSRWSLKLCTAKGLLDVCTARNVQLDFPASVATDLAALLYSFLELFTVVVFRMVRLSIWSASSANSAFAKITGPGTKVYQPSVLKLITWFCSLSSAVFDVPCAEGRQRRSGCRGPRCQQQRPKVRPCFLKVWFCSRLGLSHICIFACSSSSLTGSAFEPAGDIADEESEMITSGSGLHSSFQDEEWEDLADTKATTLPLMLLHNPVVLTVSLPADDANL